MNVHWRGPAGLHAASARLPVEGDLASFGGATGWLNSPPLTPAGLRGNVVLVDFWMPSASMSAMTSTATAACWPLRGVSSDRKRVVVAADERNQDPVARRQQRGNLGKAANGGCPYTDTPCAAPCPALPAKLRFRSR